MITLLQKDNLTELIGVPSSPGGRNPVSDILAVFGSLASRLPDREPAIVLAPITGIGAVAPSPKLILGIDKRAGDHVT
jgi:hypothetical protein